MKPPDVDASDGSNLKQWAKDNPFWAWAGAIAIVAIVGSALIDNSAGRSLPTWLMVLGLVALYFLPSLIARKKHNANSVFVINLFLGWTFIGWIIALAMAANNPPSPTVVQASPPAITTGRTCPFCAEAIQPAAIVCKHCGRDLPAAV